MDIWNKRIAIDAIIVKQTSIIIICFFIIIITKRQKEYNEQKPKYLVFVYNKKSF